MQTRVMLRSMSSYMGLGRVLKKKQKSSFVPEKNEKKKSLILGYFCVHMKRKLDFQTLTKTSA